MLKPIQKVIMFLFLGIICVQAVLLTQVFYRSMVDKILEKNSPPYYIANDFLENIDNKDTLDKQKILGNNNKPKIENTDISNWEIYRNDKYAFEFKHPKEWKPLFYETRLVSSPLESGFVVNFQDNSYVDSIKMSLDINPINGHQSASRSDQFGMEVFIKRNNESLVRIAYSRIIDGKEQLLTPKEKIDYEKIISTFKFTAEIPDEKSTIYENKKYGFTLEFPPLWKDYRVKEEQGASVFGLEDYDNVFTIGIMSKEQYTGCKNAELCTLTYIAENKDHVFVLYGHQDFPQALLHLAAGKNGWDSIVSTLKFTNN
ncbi:MAG: hypothetical protein WCO84_03440 [bacterium]